MIQIQPVTLTTFPTTLVADYVNVQSITVTPNVGASGLVQLGTRIADPSFRADPEHPEITAPWVFKAYPVYGATVALTSEQFAAWGQDDDDAVNSLLTNYGLVRA